MCKILNQYWLLHCKSAYTMSAPLPTRPSQLGSNPLLLSPSRKIIEIAIFQEDSSWNIKLVHSVAVTKHHLTSTENRIESAHQAQLTLYPPSSIMSLHFLYVVLKKTLLDLLHKRTAWLSSFHCMLRVRTNKPPSNWKRNYCNYNKPPPTKANNIHVKQKHKKHHVWDAWHDRQWNMVIIMKPPPH